MKIKPEVMTVLEQLRFDGNKAFIVGGQLERKLYVEVDKVLKACGGKWHRGSGSHVFGEEAEGVVMAAIVSGEVRTAREDGFFETPANIALQLARDIGIRRDSTVLEPSAGLGRLVHAALGLGANMVHCVEWADNRRTRLMLVFQNETRVFVHPERDFMRWCLARDLSVSHVLMNPPFYKVGDGDHLDHVRAAFGKLRSGGKLGTILPSSIVQRDDRRHDEFRRWYTEHGGTVWPLPANSFKESGTGVNTVTLLMEAR